MSHAPELEPNGEPTLHFLGVDGENSQPFFRPWTHDEVRRAAAESPGPERDVRYGVDSESPAEAGWGVVFAEGVDADVRRQLEPLLERRRSQAGDRYQALEILPNEDLPAFRRRIRAGIGRANPKALPYYLLLVGDPKQISFDFQFDLDAQHAVGRLAFPDAASYGVYAQSVIEHEEASRNSTPGLHLYSFDKENDVAMEQALRELAQPLAAEFGARKRFEFRFTRGAAADRELLTQSLHDGPPLVFTVGHSYLVTCGAKGQDEWQGSLVTGSWRGGDIRPRDVYRAANVPDDADFRGKIFYFYGCHTVGTPEVDSFDQSGTPRKLAPQPFLAPLAQRLLAPPKGKGALAVVGQVDRAYPCTSLGWDGVPQIDTFEDTLRALSDGKPVGLAMESFGQRHASVAVEMLRRMGQRDGSPVDPIPTWIAYHDARSVALLGDPLVATNTKTPDQS